MKYAVMLSDKAIKSFSKLDKYENKIIFGWIKKNLDGTDNPRRYGKALKGDLQELWRYRIGQYRLVVNIDDKKLIIIALEVGHRKDIYKKR